MKFKNFLITFFIILIGLIVLDYFVFTRAKNAPLNKIKIQFASWGSKSEIEILKPVLSKFEKENPNIEVDFIHIPQNYFQKIHLLFASNMAPDVLFINNLYLPVYANAGVLESINKDFKDKDLFFKKSLQALSFKGKLYAIPRDVSNLVIYINLDIFDKYNIPYPYFDWTFEDFLVIAQELTKDTNGDGKTDLWGISFEESPALFYLPYLMSEGGGILSDDSKKIIIDFPKSQKGLNFYADLRNKYHVAPTKAESASATMAQLFLQEKLAMHLSGRWLVPKYRTDAKFEWDVINFPAGDAGSVVPLDASGWALAKSSKHKKEAMLLIKYLSSKESIEKLTESGLIVPARIDVAEGGFMQNKDKKPPENNKVFIDIIKTSKPTPVSVNYNEVQDDLKKKTDYLFNLN
jgi:multiple sugar transport system substrate-binding protein